MKTKEGTGERKKRGGGRNQIKCVDWTRFNSIVIIIIINNNTRNVRDTPQSRTESHNKTEVTILSLSLCIHILGYLWAYVRTHRTQCARFLYIFWVKYFVEVNRFFYRLTHRMSFFVLGKFFSLNKFIYILFPSVLSKFFFCFTPHTHVTISFRVA